MHHTVRALSTRVYNLIQTQQKVPRKFHRGIASTEKTSFSFWSYFPWEKELAGGKDDTSSPPLSPCLAADANPHFWPFLGALPSPFHMGHLKSVRTAELCESSPGAGAAKNDLLQPLCADRNNPFPQRTADNFCTVFLWQPREEVWGSMAVVDLEPHETWTFLFCCMRGVRKALSVCSNPSTAHLLQGGFPTAWLGGGSLSSAPCRHMSRQLRGAWWWAHTCSPATINYRNPLLCLYHTFLWRR